LDQRPYPWGESFDPRHCNSREAEIGTTTSVDKFSPVGDSPFGVGDMVGNVWEWVLDWYAPTYGEPNPSRNPSGPGTGKARVIRGGSYINNETLVTCFARDFALPDMSTVNYGFRVRLDERIFDAEDNGVGAMIRKMNARNSAQSEKTRGRA
jgi:formylglycine-generating enzyme required for sulfatase activity